MHGTSTGVRRLGGKLLHGDHHGCSVLKDGWSYPVIEALLGRPSRRQGARQQSGLVGVTRSMARYFFHFHDGTDQPDHTGTELASAQAARDAAVVFMATG